MEDLRRIIGKNMTELRRSAGYTQLELAEKLNYSDKAVSKWESGASVPDIAVLYDIAKLYGVTVDYLLSEEHKIPVKEMVRGTVLGRKHLLITLISVVLVWLCATASFVLMSILGVSGDLWLSFVWAAPVSCAVALVLNCIWGKKKYTFVFVSVLLWTLIAAVYLTFLHLNLWLIFLIGVPVQVIICLWAGMMKKA